MERHVRVLVTGAAGFIGSHLVDVLKRSYPAHYIASIVHRVKRPPAQTWSCDLSKARCVNALLSRLRPGLIFHVAGKTRGTLEELMTANLRTTLNVLEAASQINPSMRIVVLGSAAECGDPVSPYAWSKRCQTRLVQQKTAEGQNIVVARLYNLTGPRLSEGFVAGSIARQMAEAEATGGRWISIGNLNSRRDFLDVRDAVQAIVMVAERGQNGQMYEVCSGKSHSIRAVLNLLLRQTSRRLHVRSVAAAKSTSTDIRISVGDPRLLRRWGWRPQISLEDSLRDTLNDYRSLYG